MQLACTFVLIDSRHKPQKIDLEFMEYLGLNGIPFCIVFTKADKLNASTLPKNIEAYKKELLTTWEELPTYFVSSSSDKRGREEILNFIEDVNLRIRPKN